MSNEKPKVEVFYADPVDENGNVIGHVGEFTVTTPWGSVEPVKVPHDEIVLDPETTIRAKAPPPKPVCAEPSCTSLSCGDWTGRCDACSEAYIDLFREVDL